jgi:hypothetical protein
MEKLNNRLNDASDAKKKSDALLRKMAEWMGQLDRAGQRRDNAVAAIREVERAIKAEKVGEIIVPQEEIVKAVYEGSTERMKTRILGRQDKEKKVRDKHEKNLKAFRVRQKDWSAIAKSTSELAILHRPDQVAGGYDAFEKLKEPPASVTDYNDPEWMAYFAALRRMFGPAAVNSLIGKQWKKQIEGLATHMIEKVPARMSHPIYSLNLTLRIDPRDT